MMAEINLLRHYPRGTRKMETPRSLDPANRETALKFGAEYFDGKREQGYGGYRYDGRWVPIARDIVAARPPAATRKSWAVRATFNSAVNDASAKAT